MSELRVDIADLLAHPGARREVHLEAALADLGTSVVHVAADAPVVLDLLFERVSDGIVVRGDVSAVWRAECSRCLTDLEERMTRSVSELYEPEPIDGETYLLEAPELDLEQLVRDAVLLELPLAPHCGPDRAGQCAGLAAADDAADHEPTDPRWAALSELEL